MIQPNCSDAFSPLLSYIARSETILRISTIALTLLQRILWTIPLLAGSFSHQKSTQNQYHPSLIFNLFPLLIYLVTIWAVTNQTGIHSSYICRIYRSDPRRQPIKTTGINYAQYIHLLNWFFDRATDESLVENCSNSFDQLPFVLEGTVQGRPSYMEVISKISASEKYSNSMPPC